MKKENPARGKESEYEDTTERVVQGIKNIADLFIGTLNNTIGGMSLRERIRESLLGMEKKDSLVPSTDGTQPTYIIDVYSSQSDFAQGIVRVDVVVRPVKVDTAARPVRAMDYIYATVTVSM